MRAPKLRTYGEQRITVWMHVFAKLNEYLCADRLDYPWESV